MSSGDDACETCLERQPWTSRDDNSVSHPPWRVRVSRSCNWGDSKQPRRSARKFRAIEGAIERSRRLLDLTKGWDDESAEPIKESTWRRATSFLRRTVQAVFRRSSVVLPTPHISPCADGSIDLLWKTSHFRLLVNIQPEGEGDSDFFGETPNGLSVKGTFRPEEREFGFIDWLAT